MRRQGRHRIERAALELFSEKGIVGCSTRAITERAGLAEGTLFRHFPTKDDLAVSLFLSCAGRLLSRLESAVSEATEPETQLEAVVHAFFAFAAEEPEAHAYIMHHHPDVALLPPGTRLPKDVVHGVVSRGIAAGRFRSMDPILATAIVAGMIIRALFFMRQGLLRDSPETVRDEVSRAALRALKEIEP